MNKTSEIVPENPYGTVSHARWVLVLLSTRLRSFTRLKARDFGDLCQDKPISHSKQCHMHNIELNFYFVISKDFIEKRYNIECLVHTILKSTLCLKRKIIHSVVGLFT